MSDLPSPTELNDHHVSPQSPDRGGRSPSPLTWNSSRPSVRHSTLSTLSGPKAHHRTDTETRTDALTDCRWAEARRLPEMLSVTARRAALCAPLALTVPVPSLCAPVRPCSPSSCTRQLWSRPSPACSPLAAAGVILPPTAANRIYRDRRPGDVSTCRLPRAALLPARSRLFVFLIV